MSFDLLISVVLYHNQKSEIESLLNSCSGSKLKLCLVFVDNAPGSIDYDFQGLPSFAKYRPMPKNLGYGRAHNQVILDPQLQSKYYLIANPDVRFTAKDLEDIYVKMESEPGISLLMPKIIWPDGMDQGLRKLLPHPGDLFLRRFIPNFLRPFFKSIEERYQLKNLDPTKEMLVPALSGCFMFCRHQILKGIGGFDPRYFLYLEDVDLSRRLGERGTNMYWPEVQVVHEYQKSSYRSIKPLLLHLQSAIKYFNKFGWFIDPDRKSINQKALSQKQ